MPLTRLLATACLAALAALPIGCATQQPSASAAAAGAKPFTIVLGIAQDGGVPQAGSFGDARWDNPRLQRSVVCLGIVDPRSGKRWMIDATPDFRRQLLDLNRVSPELPAAAPSRTGRTTSRPIPRTAPSNAAGDPRPVLDGIFLTHAHMGHYTGLMFLGKESIGANAIPVWAMPRMAGFLEENGPWNQLVNLKNIELRPLVAGESVQLAEDISITPVLVPHRQEYSETVCFRIQGPDRAVLWLPDIDSWRELDDIGPRIEGLVESVDAAYLDGTFFANGEIPGRDMSGFPHPFIRDSLKRFILLPPSERAKIRFIHLNHTNPALDPSSSARREIEALGLRVADEGEIATLGR